jgi:tetratricopeptide (TPR) repeat protein
VVLIAARLRAAEVWGKDEGSMAERLMRCRRNPSPVRSGKLRLKSLFSYVAAVVCMAVAAAFPVPAAGQQSVYARERNEAAQDLARQSLACLRRGEDAFDVEVRRQAYTEGAELAKKAVAADDLNADAHFALFANNGRLQLLDGTVPNPFNLAKANRELERTLELDPNHADALAAKGGLYRQLPRLLGGNEEKAEECLTRAIDLNPNSIGARVELAQLYHDQGSTQRSLPLLRSAVEVAEREGRFKDLAEARLLLKQYDNTTGD